MKKTVKILCAVCAIAMLVGLLPIMSVSAADTATLVVTPSKDSVKAGREFTITFTVTNNTGLGGIAFDMPIDTAAFEFVDASYEGMIFPNIGFCEMDSKGTTFKFNANGTGRSNITTNGLLATLTLRAKEDITLGKYTFNAAIDQKNTVIVTGEDPNFSSELATMANASASINVVANVATSTIDSAMVQLGADIAVNYFVTLDEDHAGAQMRFTFGEDVTVVNGVATETANEYIYTFTGIAPQAMGDNLKAELIFGGNVVATKAEYSVLTNCQNLLSKSAAQLGLNNAQYAAMKTLIADLLVYGAKAQLYRNYNTSALVDAGVTGATALGAIDATNDIKTVDPNPSANANIKFTAAGVFFDYINSVYFKFTAPDVTASNFKVVITKYDDEFNAIGTEEYTIDDCTLIDEATSTYVIYTEDVSVLDYGTAYSAELQTKSGFKYNSVQFFAYSINSYAYAKQNTENERMADLAKALYNYGVSAAAFQNSFNG